MLVSLNYESFWNEIQSGLVPINKLCMFLINCLQDTVSERLNGVSGLQVPPFSKKTFMPLIILILIGYVPLIKMSNKQLSVPMSS